VREAARRARPDFPWLAVDDLPGLRRYLAGTGWLEAGEAVLRCERAGEGNMNLTLRVATDRRSLVLKQARPWVEKYPEIAAPWDRSRFEQRFYARVASIPGVASRMPQLLGSDERGATLLLEDLGAARDCSSVYAGGETLPEREVDELAAYLRALHDASEGAPDPALANRDMRALNAEHLFRVPLDASAAPDPEPFEPGLTGAAGALRADPALRSAFAELEERYRAPGPCLLHGDYFPGSWLRTGAGVRVIDPEFGFQGEPAIDVGCAVAHLALGRQSVELCWRFLAAYGRALDVPLLAGFAAVEVVRRLLGVAQLPIPPSRGWRAQLLERARSALREGRVEPFFT
jgi:5-methylthioribose kinase